MQRVRARLIADRKEEVEGVARMIYSEKKSRGEQGLTDGFADWVEAENRVIQTTFERQTGCTLSLTSSMLVSLILVFPLCLHVTVSAGVGSTGACISHSLTPTHGCPPAPPPPFGPPLSAPPNPNAPPPLAFSLA